MPASLLDPMKLGRLTLPNRVIFAPCTRCRADANRAPHPLNAEYYRQRASAGLLISEATQVCEEGIGYIGTPGIHSKQQVDGWKLVTDAVHTANGRIYMQLWHVGRASHNAFQPNNAAPVSSSAIACRGTLTLPDFSKAAYPTPRALSLQEIPAVIEQYRRGARNAIEAGMDGVELHGANGYLPDQFLRDGVNKRTDNYGGSVENRARFMLEAVQALIDVCGADRVGVRLSPSGVFNDMSDSNPRETFGYVVRELSKLRIAYLHLTEATDADRRHGAQLFPTYEAIPVTYFRPLFDGPVITNAGFTFNTASRCVQEGDADAVAFGVGFIANPDLPERFRRMAAGVPTELNTPDPSTFYAGGEKGYTDYPFLRD